MLENTHIWFYNFLNSSNDECTEHKEQQCPVWNVTNVAEAECAKAVMETSI
jgi:hypothetical protein